MTLKLFDTKLAPRLLNLEKLATLAGGLMMFVGLLLSFVKSLIN